MILLTMFLATPSFGAEDILSSYTGSLRDSLYVVDSSELDPNESLNRVSGNIDRGFSGSDSTYQSASHYLAGPFGQQGTRDNADGAE